MRQSQDCRKIQSVFAVQLSESYLIALFCQFKASVVRPFSEDDLREIFGKMRILDEHRAGEVGTDKIVIFYSLGFCSVIIAESAPYGKGVVFNSADLGAFVDESDERLAEEIRLKDRVGCQPLFILLDRCKAEQPESVIRFAAAVRDALSEQLERVAGEQRGL